MDNFDYFGGLHAWDASWHESRAIVRSVEKLPTWSLLRVDFRLIASPCTLRRLRDIRSCRLACLNDKQSGDRDFLAKIGPIN